MVGLGFDPVNVKIPKYVEIQSFEFSAEHCLVTFEVGIEGVREMDLLNFLSYMQYLNFNEGVDDGKEC